MIINTIVYVIFFASTLFSGIITDPISGEKQTLYNKSWAVIIGIDDYQNVKPLDYCVSDANSIESIMIEKFGFDKDNIFKLVNQEATLNGIRNTFSKIMKEAGKDDQILIYFAGHGITEDLPDGGEIGYLVPFDGKEEEAYLTCLPMEELKTVSQRSSARQVMFLVDACHGGLAAVNTRSVDSNSKDYIAKITKMKSRQIISAGGKDDKVVEKAEWGHSAFTYKLIHGLRDGLADKDEDNIITASELYSFLRKSVTTLSGYIQTPRFNNLSNDEGEYIFLIEKDDNEISPTMLAVENLASNGKFGTLFIETIPSMAMISMENKELGISPFEEIVPTGQYFIKVEKENYNPEFSMVSVRDKEKSNIKISLTYSDIFIDKEFANYNKKLKNNKLLKNTALISIIGSASAQIYFDNKARNYWDNYSESVLISDMDNYYELYTSQIDLKNISTGILVSSVTSYLFFRLKKIYKPEYLD
tara:strand:+ start:65 stop:1486 length:1422 start_codon:yes stop_codon:yes gene_type:complete